MSQTYFELWMSKDKWKQYSPKAKKKWYDERRQFVDAMPEGLQKKEYQAFVEKTAHVQDDDLTNYMKEWNDLKNRQFWTGNRQYKTVQFNNLKQHHQFWRGNRQYVTHQFNPFIV